MANCKENRHLDERPLPNPWLIPLGSGWRRRAATRRLIRAAVARIGGAWIITAELPQTRAARAYVAGRRVCVRSSATDYVGTIERTAGSAGSQHLVIRLAGAGW